MSVAHLPGVWLRTARSVGAKGDVAGVGARLLAAYGDPARGHHDLRHLDDVLRTVDDLAHRAADPDAVRLAAWFHDAVYDVHATDSEERSAELAGRELRRLRVPAARVAEVGRLVLLTRTHDPASDDVDGAVLCDADLAVLAADPARYRDFTEGVRREYAHVPDEQFAAGRSAVLRSLLELPALYRTPEARTWEPVARANVEAELARLSPGAPPAAASGA
ncbi:MAG: HD domain-containing protein [Motilibacteraceae bacterium]